MITAVHALVYAHDPGRARQFFRDVLGWPYVDAHDGWLIFKTGPSELGVHPTEGTDQGGSQQTFPDHHEISLMCDDLEVTMQDLKRKGATFLGEPTEQSFGRTISLEVPGAGSILPYEARHVTAYDR